ncbi:MAG: phosphoadenosine phosphosulfate reductase family protein [Porticoccaceae bacterium]|nr:phosphoadenosine phosphosulfate reductase family protein [Porticoccaceae bacterium]
MSLAAAQKPTFNDAPQATHKALFDLSNANLSMADASPVDILLKALNASKQPIISTSFSAYSAVLLHMVQSVRPGTPVVWCDSGFNTAATYRFVDQLTKDLNLNLKVFHPAISAAHLEARYKGIPEIGSAEHAEFTKIVKLEPFSRAFSELKPDLWINGIRREETEFRKSQDIFTWDAARATTKVAPCFHCTTMNLVDYLLEHNLPSEVEYHDPTKAAEHLECGLHT